MTVISVMLLLEKPLRKLMSKLKIRPLVRSYHNMRQQAEVALLGSTTTTTAASSAATTAADDQTTAAETTAAE